MGAPQYEQAGADIGGTGTTNTIPRWTGPSTLGDSGLIDNGTAVYTTTRNVGIGTASPNAILSVYNAGTPTISLWNSSNYTRFSTNTNDCFVDVGLGGTAGAVVFRRSSGATESARIDSAGRLIVGSSTSPGLSTGFITAVGASSSYLATFKTAATAGGCLLGSGADPVELWRTSGTFGAETYTKILFADTSNNLILNTANTGATIQAAGSQQGLKLPATPGNGNANTLDSYQEGTRVLSAGDLSGWTYVTATQYWTLVGRTVTLHTVFTGGTSSATGGATIATPPLLTPLRIAAGAAVNSSGTALGNGACVVGPTSSTTGTVITSSAISSSAVDKVLTVTYETAGL